MSEQQNPLKSTVHMQLRLPDAVHLKVRMAAKEAGISINALILLAISDWLNSEQNRRRQGE